MRSLRQAQPDTDPVDFLKLAGRAYVEFGLRNPGAYEFAFILRRPGRQRRLKPHLAYLELKALVARCVEEKRFAPIDVEALNEEIQMIEADFAIMHKTRPADEQVEVAESDRLERLQFVVRKPLPGNRDRSCRSPWSRRGRACTEQAIWWSGAPTGICSIWDEPIIK
jgi:hypothetical protein